MFTAVTGIRAVQAFKLHMRTSSFSAMSPHFHFSSQDQRGPSAAQTPATQDDVDVPPEEFKKMQDSLKKFAQCMTLGKYAAAQMVLTEHRADIERWFPDDHPAHLSVDNNQGLLLKLDGNFEEARRIFERVTERYTYFYGEAHPSTINALVNLGTVLKDVGEFEEAIPVFERVIEGRRATEGDTSINYAMAKAMAAGAYREVGEYDKADLMIKDAYTIVAMEYGEDNVTISAILNS